MPSGSGSYQASSAISNCRTATATSSRVNFFASTRRSNRSNHQNPTRFSSSPSKVPIIPCINSGPLNESQLCIKASSNSSHSSCLIKPRSSNDNANHYSRSANLQNSSPSSNAAAAVMEASATNSSSTVNRSETATSVQEKLSPISSDEPKGDGEKSTISSLTSNLESSLTLNQSSTGNTMPNVSIHSVKDNLDKSDNCISNSHNSHMIADSTAAAAGHGTSESSSSSFHQASSTSNCDFLRTLNVPKFGRPVPNRVFVGGIPCDASEHDVRQLFAQFGSINSVKIINDRAGVSRGYGFVTFDSDEDAQKVIKEADNLIIKHRKLNVSPAVMKHPNGFESRSLSFNNGSYLYPQLPFGGTANYSQYFPENFHGICAAEGLPLFQIAGMNGHFMSGCPSYLTTSPGAAQYMTAQSGSPYTQPAYQGSTNYLYSPVSPTQAAAAAGLPLATQHSLYHAQPQSANAHLMPVTSVPSSHQAFQYSNNVCGPQATASGTSPNGSTMHAMRYPLPPNQTTTNPSSQPVNLNSNQQQQYIQYTSTTSPAMSHPASMHLSAAVPIHHQNAPTHLTSLQLNQISDVANANHSSGLSSGAPNASMNTALLSHTHHQHVPPQSSAHVYNYASNPLASAHALSAGNPNSIACLPNVHLKSDGSGIELLDNVHSGMMNGHGATVNTTSIASLPSGMHNGYLPPMMEVIWPSHMHTNAGAYCNNGPVPVSNSSNAYVNVQNLGVSGGASGGGVTCHAKSTMHSAASAASNNIRNGPILSSSINCGNGSNANSGKNIYPKSSHNSLLPDGHLTGGGSTAHTTAVNVCANSSASSSNGSMNQNCNVPTLKEKGSNSRHSNSSYNGTSHRKMYNGANGNNHYGNSSVKPRPTNGGCGILSNGNARYPTANLGDAIIEHSVACPPPADALHSSLSGSKHHIGNAAKQLPLAPPQATANVNSVCANNHNVTTNGGGSGGMVPNLITKTVNGVQIYALAGNNNDETVAPMNGTGSPDSSNVSPTSPQPPPPPPPPPLVASGANTIVTTVSTAVSFTS